MFSNHELIAIDLWLLKLEVYWGWDNGEGRLGLNALDFSMLKDWGDISIFQFTAWVLSVSLFLKLDGLIPRAADESITLATCQCFKPNIRFIYDRKWCHACERPLAS